MTLNSKFAKILFAVLALAAILAGWQMVPEAASGGYSWYCPHAKGHVQPTVPELAFVETLDGFYLDHRHSDPDDAEKVIYLTFDAGYGNENVEKILDILKEEQVPACFFILDGLIRHEPELVKRMAAEGHTVGNHTMHHRDMSREGNEALLAELRGLEDAYRNLTGCEMAKYYRPPEGRFSRENLACAQKNGYRTVFWSFAYPDWDNNKQPSPEKAKQIILDNAHNGEVMLLHPTSATNAAVLGEVIRTLRAEGYRFGIVDELTGGATEAVE